MLISALTNKFNGIARVITSDIVVQNTANSKSLKTKGIWDTGATGSAITKNLAKDLSLIPIGRVKVKGVHGDKDVNVYPVKITLNNEDVSFVLPVTECDDLTDDNTAMFLIGMDIISQGDFSITNFNGKTIMSYRKPSLSNVDFVEQLNHGRPITKSERIGRNDPCPCGSGKKYKHCHGK